MRTLAKAMDAFRPVGPLTTVQQMRMMKLQNAYEALVTEIIDLVPENDDRCRALDKLLESKFSCVQIITHCKELRNDPLKEETKVEETPQAPPQKGDVEIAAEQLQAKAEAEQKKRQGGEREKHQTK